MISGCNQPSDKKTTLEKKAPIEQVNKKDAVKSFNNPALIYGSDFLSFFSALKVNCPGKLDTLLYYTSKQSKATHTKNEILLLYKNRNINFRKKLRAISKINDTLFVLNYSCSRYATVSMVTCTVSVEDGICRILLPNKLSEFLK